MPTRTIQSPQPSQPLSPRRELFCLHVARGASLAQAARSAGYSPVGARQRGSLLMTESVVRSRVDVLRLTWASEREGVMEQAVECLDEIIGMSSDLRQPAVARKAIELMRKLRGLIQDERTGPGSCLPASAPVRAAAA
jgi:phage terminase small subunit